MKRACNNCGQVHLNLPFVDCFKGDPEDLPDDLQQYYNDKFGCQDE